MIKCNVTVCGTIGRIPVVRAGKEGKQFTTFGVNVQIPVKNAAKKLVEVSAIQDGGLAEGTAGLTIGTRVEVTGVLTFKKRGEALYLNLNAASITQVGADKPDLIQGDMHFRGKLGKTIEMKNDKKRQCLPCVLCFQYRKGGRRICLHMGALRSLLSRSRGLVGGESKHRSQGAARIVGVQRQTEYRLSFDRVG